jgi:hypothetical protein
VNGIDVAQIPTQVPSRYSAGFAFVLNPFFSSSSLPAEVAPGLVLDKATPEEREAVTFLIGDLGGMTKWGMLFCHEPIPRETRESPEWDRKLWPRETYWVLRATGDSRLVQRICEASQLCETEFELGSVFPPPGRFAPHVIFPDSFFYYTQFHWNGEAQKLDADDLRLVNPLHLRIEEFRNAQEDDLSRGSVVRLFDEFISLSAGRRWGEWPLLRYFALIGGLITHDPKPGVRDSITHQLSTKMPLLMKRFARPLALSDFANENDAGKLWRLLYRLRSRIAHGEEGFSAEKQPELRDLPSTIKLVRESLKRLFVLALQEPEFLFDLKAC